MRASERTKLLKAAISKLADLFEFGQLLADTAPAAFLTTVHDEIVRLRSLHREPVQGAGRPETGPMQFGDDWPGVFIRGDNALFYAMSLEQADGPFKEMTVRGLAALLRSCAVRPGNLPANVQRVAAAAIEAAPEAGREGGSDAT